MMYIENDPKMILLQKLGIKGEVKSKKAHFSHTATNLKSPTEINH